MSQSGFSSIEDLIAQSKRGSQNSSAQTEPVVDEADMSSAGAAQHHLDEKMDAIRLQNEEQETQKKARELGLPYIDLVAFPIGPEVLANIPEETAKEYKLILFFHYDEQVRIGMVNPEDPGALAYIEKLQVRHPQWNIAQYAISQHSFDASFKLYKAVAKVKEIEYGVHITKEQLEAYQEELTSFEIMEDKLQSSNMTETFAMIISMALNTGSSDVHIESEKKEIIVRFRIDGVLTDVARLPEERMRRLVARIKTIAGLKINITKVPQDGRITVEFDTEDQLDIRVSTLPSAFGESIVFRLLRSSSVGLTFEELGMRPLMFEKLKAEIEKTAGMIITTGPTGSGKTTSLYAMLNKVNTPENKIVTLENPIEYKLKGVVQSPIDTSDNYSFADGLRGILRQDPDIVMVGEIRDSETAKTAINAANTGHLLFSTMHTNDAAGTIPRFLSLEINPTQIDEALNAVIGQRLVRRICETCKSPYTPDQKQLSKMQEFIDAIPENSGEVKPVIQNVTFYKGQGCDECRGSGYKGRIGIYELFTLNKEISEEITTAEHISESRMRDILQRSGMVTMGQDGVLKVVDGVTTLDEVFRVSER